MLDPLLLNSCDPSYTLRFDPHFGLEGAADRRRLLAVRTSAVLQRYRPGLEQVFNFVCATKRYRDPKNKIFGYRQQTRRRRTTRFGTSETSKGSGKGLSSASLRKVNRAVAADALGNSVARSLFQRPVGSERNRSTSASVVATQPAPRPSEEIATAAVWLDTRALPPTTISFNTLLAFNKDIAIENDRFGWIPDGSSGFYDAQLLKQAWILATRDHEIGTVAGPRNEASEATCLEWCELVGFLALISDEAASDEGQLERFLTRNFFPHVACVLDVPKDELAESASVRAIQRRRQTRVQRLLGVDKKQTVQAEWGAAASSASSASAPPPMENVVRVLSTDPHKKSC